MAPQPGSKAKAALDWRASRGEAVTLRRETSQMSNLNSEGGRERASLMTEEVKKPLLLLKGGILEASNLCERKPLYSSASCGVAKYAWISDW